jgi:hypothetical protein
MHASVAKFGLRSWAIGIMGFITLAASCLHDPVQPNPPPVAGADCKSACDHLASLGCELAKPTAKGTSCKTWCEATANKPAGMDTGCAAAVQTCAQADRCGR